jgi:hypothetical protein
VAINIQRCCSCSRIGHHRLRGRIISFLIQTNFSYFINQDHIYITIILFGRRRLFDSGHRPLFNLSWDMNHLLHLSRWSLINRSIGYVRQKLCVRSWMRNLCQNSSLHLMGVLLLSMVSTFLVKNLIHISQICIFSLFVLLKLVFCLIYVDCISELSIHWRWVNLTIYKIVLIQTVSIVFRFCAAFSKFF